MLPDRFSRSLIAVALGSLVTFAAAAQSDERASREKELEAARAQLQQSARRVAELSRELGRPGDGPVMFEQRMLSKPVLGVLLDMDDERGVRVSGVTPESGAAKAGLRSGDRIVSIDGTAVSGATGAERLEKLRAMLDGPQAGAPVRVGYEREGRTATASVTPAKAAPIALFDIRADGAAPGPHRRISGPAGDGAGRRRIEIQAAPGAIEHGEDGRIIRRVILDGAPGKDGETRAFAFGAPGIAPEVHREVIRLARDPQCKDGQDCRALALAEAFRWNGLNLASVDAGLGRYFGTRDGVLVISAGPELAGLQSGDVIRAVDGKRVTSPREVMDVLRGKSEGATVAVEYLRDRQVGTTQIKAPKAMRIPLPRAPRAPAAPDAPPASAAPTAPGGAAMAFAAAAARRID